MYNIYPKVKKQLNREGFFTFDKVNLFCEKNKNVFIDLQNIIKINETSEELANIKYLIKDNLESQEYEIEINPDCICIYASEEVGMYYATKSLKQIIEDGKVECGYIKDKPDLKIRGFMHDISRNKVPKLETLKYIVDVMSDLKMNHFELYVEGFSFEYKSFERYLEDESYITVKEYQELEKYCNDHYIDLVPNQNGLGHMEQWLEKDEFKNLAEAPEGIHLWGSHRPPSTLNVLDPKSFELVEKMYDDMLPISTSKYFHMNLDEPFELGKNKTKDICLEQGKENVYLDFVKKLKTVVDRYGKTPLIWGDVLINHDNVLDKIPKDMIFVDWGYDAEYPFEKNLKKLKNAGIKFMAAPATTSWCSLLTRTTDYLENISAAVWHTYELDGEGIIITDWGDIGHMQHLSASLPPLVYAGLLSYRVTHGVFKDMKYYLNKFVFKDEKEIAADVFMDAGSYLKYEPHYTGNGSVTFYSMVWALNSFKEDNPVEYYRRRMKYNLYNLEQYTLLMDFFKQKKKEINMCAIDQLFKDEMINSINILEMLANIMIGYNEMLDSQFRFDKFNEAYELVDLIIKDLKRLWLVRNKYSRLNYTIQNLLKIKEFIIKSIDYYQGGNDER